MTLIWLVIFWLTGSDWPVTFGFGNDHFTTAATWLVICVACDLGKSATNV